MAPSLVHFFGQDYAALLRQHAGHKESGALFVDDKFPASSQSIGPALSAKYPKIVWKRPHEIAAGARLLVDGASTNDIVQGHIGNCWLVTACCVLAGNREYLDEVFPDKEAQDMQMTDDKQYAGIVRFRFWRMGKRIEVVVDDTLPVNQETGQLIFAQSKASNEFWASLLEKAYAKLVGSYERLDTGSTADALVDFTNGVVDDITVDDQTDVKRLFERLAHARRDGALVTASIGALDVPEDERERPGESGLVPGHAYAITAIQRIKHRGFFNFEQFEMIRLRNPWGEGEWTGAWADNSEEWKKISDADKKKLGLVKADDGEFWMSFQDFVQHFNKIVLCRVINTALLSTKSTFHVFTFNNSWTKLNSGGSTNHPDTFLNNPQFMLTLKHKAKVIVSLMQEDHRGGPAAGSGSSMALTTESGPPPSANVSIGFVIMQTEANRMLRMVELGKVAHKVDYINARQLSSRCELMPGNYVIVPSTFEPGQTSEFLLRVFVETSLLRVSTLFAKCEPLVATKPKEPRCKGPYKYRITVNVIQADNLRKSDMMGQGADPYLLVRCTDSTEGCCAIQSRETQEARGFVICNDTLNPKFNESFVFFSHTLDQALVNVQIWNYNTVRADDFMGEVNVVAETAMVEGKYGGFVDYTLECERRPSVWYRNEDNVTGNVTLQVRVQPL